MNRREWLKRAAVAVAAVPLLGGVAKALERTLSDRYHVRAQGFDTQGRLVEIDMPNAIIRPVDWETIELTTGGDGELHWTITDMGPAEVYYLR